jgi:hypothetical protein
MLKVILAKIGISLFRYLPLEQIVAKLLTSVIRKLLASRRATWLIDHVNQTRLEILQTWSKGDSAKELEAQLPG